MKVVLFGSSGMIGSRIAAELERRGHAVTAAPLLPTQMSLIRSICRRQTWWSVRSRRGARPAHSPLSHPTLVERLREAGVRSLVVVGGAGSLEVAPGNRLLDTPTSRGVQA